VPGVFKDCAKPNCRVVYAVIVFFEFSILGFLRVCYFVSLSCVSLMQV
jgi:hypothetical protein